MNDMQITVFAIYEYRTEANIQCTYRYVKTYRSRRPSQRLANTGQQHGSTKTVAKSDTSEFNAA